MTGQILKFSLDVGDFGGVRCFVSDCSMSVSTAAADR